MAPGSLRASLQSLFAEGAVYRHLMTRHDCIKGSGTEALHALVACVHFNKRPVNSRFKTVQAIALFSKRGQRLDSYKTIDTAYRSGLKTKPTLFTHTADVTSPP